MPIRNKTILHVLSLCLLAVSCSTIIEDRGECPCYLNVEVSSRYDLYDGPGSAWCNVFGDRNSLVALSEVVDVNSRDTTLTYVIAPRQPVSVIVSSTPVRSGSIVADRDSDFHDVWVTRRDADCNAEETTVRIDQLNKQFCALTITLEKGTRNKIPITGVDVTADYNGIQVPSMRPNVGRFHYATDFDEGDRATVCLPRQGGYGLTLIVKIDGSTKDVPIDLYGIMASTDYAWNEDNLRDFQIEISVDEFGIGAGVRGWVKTPEQDIHVD